ncbi:MAG: hypothetical protein ABI609_18710 [Acidobacteriota bacterium]
MPEPAVSSFAQFRSTLPAALIKQLRSGRELVRADEAVHREAPLPTSLAELDRLLGGGLERGALTELIGGRSSGRFGMVLAALAAATTAGEATALIDLGNGLDPQAALDAGCRLERLLWARPERLRDALAATEMALQSGFALVVLDLGCPPVPGGRSSESSWVRLQRAAAAQGAALFVSAPYRVSGTAAATVLRARVRRVLWNGADGEPRLLAALAAHLAIEKSRASTPLSHQTTTREAQLALRVPGSFAAEILAAVAARPGFDSAQPSGRRARQAFPPVQRVSSPRLNVSNHLILAQPFPGAMVPNHNHPSVSNHL